ncbi:unnamed protein product, partial [Meganyctiphanes norvegica]
MSSDIESRFVRATGGYGSTGYGEYASASSSGYGHMRYVDCNSALALLGFILFVDILRDVIEYITMPTKRKKRWALSPKDSDVLSFIMDGGADHLYDNLPNILVPLLENFWKFDVSEEGLQCMQHNFCTANYDLADNYGKAGRVFGTLLSNVVSRAVSEGSNSQLQAMLLAAKTGRRGENCASKFSNCPFRNTK